MRYIRIGNDIRIKWDIFREGNPESFDGRTANVRVLAPDGSEANIEYKIENNSIYIDFYGKEQEITGRYTLLLIENDGVTGMSTIDKVSAFCLVRHSEMEGGTEDCPNIKTENISLESNFSITHTIRVVDSLDSDSKTDALSANQGKVLKGMIMSIDEDSKIKVSSTDIDSIKVMTQAEYDSLPSYDKRILYVIVDE